MFHLHPRYVLQVLNADELPPCCHLVITEVRYIDMVSFYHVQAAYNHEYLIQFILFFRVKYNAKSNEN
jgi:hypothetical protein